MEGKYREVEMPKSLKGMLWALLIGLAITIWIIINVFNSSNCKEKTNVKTNKIVFVVFYPTSNDTIQLEGKDSFDYCVLDGQCYIATNRNIMFKTNAPIKILSNTNDTELSDNGVKMTILNHKE